MTRIFMAEAVPPGGQPNVIHVVDSFRHVVAMLRPRPSEGDQSWPIFTEGPEIPGEDASGLLVAVNPMLVEQVRP